MKRYELTGCTTYATLSRTYKAGTAYTADDIGAGLDALDGRGDPYFTQILEDESELDAADVIEEIEIPEVSPEPEAAPTPKKLRVGSRKANPGTKQPSGGATVSV